ncbi:MAG: hypothetical protein D6769_02255 [Methanobacteriota archaeon]|nr:MAG: hypothetical protein D6769_02255 [Euryarchaeota archaeon]
MKAQLYTLDVLLASLFLLIAVATIQVVNVPAFQVREHTLEDYLQSLTLSLKSSGTFQAGINNQSLMQQVVDNLPTQYCGTIELYKVKKNESGDGGEGHEKCKGEGHEKNEGNPGHSDDNCNNNNNNQQYSLQQQYNVTKAGCLNATNSQQSYAFVLDTSNNNLKGKDLYLYRVVLWPKLS